MDENSEKGQLSPNHIPMKRKKRKTKKKYKFAAEYSTKLCQIELETIYMISVAWECMLMKNYSGMMQLTNGLHHPCMSRLSAIWTLLEPRFQRKFERLKMSSDMDRGKVFV